MSLSPFAALPRTRRPQDYRSGHGMDNLCPWISNGLAGFSAGWVKMVQRGEGSSGAACLCNRALDTA
eukprot:358404-Chlamydomonas_euryale.AAC.4